MIGIGSERTNRLSDKQKRYVRAQERSSLIARQEWQAFVGVVQLQFHQADADVPILPPKDIIVSVSFIAFFPLSQPPSRQIIRY